MKTDDLLPQGYEEQWVLLWCQESSMLHIEMLPDMISAHARAFREDIGLKFLPLAIGPRALIDRVEATIRPTIASRWNAKHADRKDGITYEQLP